MASTVEWLYPPRILLMRYFDRIVVDDIPHGAAILESLLAEAEVPVHMIIDLSGIKEVGIVLRDLKTAAPPNQPKIHWMAVITPNSVFRFLASAAIQFSSGHYRMFATHDEAINFLITQDASLQDIIPDR